jgi:hypothetical protein
LLLLHCHHLLLLLHRHLLLILRKVPLPGPHVFWVRNVSVSVEIVRHKHTINDV